ncbi:MAG TPA: DNA-directed RNA polymerase subunit beta' [Candidatus Babeliales bacterium]|nr:DNA-directed RNA polymerase subunit beta' [Candidatus Babeliales bacterium]
MSNQMLERFKEYINVTQFNVIKISLASPKKIRSLSYGEVKKIETINYRTLKPERDGLFCARIFGPVKDWECNCGKYKRMKHRGITCEKCGVEVIQSRVRRERMGHIQLVAPVCHIWYLKGIPSYLGLVLDMPVKDLERVIYFDMYMVIRQGKSPYPAKTLLTSVEYENYVMQRSDDTEFMTEIGAEAIRLILSFMDLKIELEKLQADYIHTSSVAVRHKLTRRIKVITGLVHGGISPDWMVISILPVLPPDLRPLVPLEGGRFASSDLNELYRRVLNRNIRLQRLIEIDAPGVIIKNEKRMLQESVDALIDNGRRGQAVRGSNKRPLKSLSEMLRGKQGRFRQNLLGRRVDYSGRSVIVVDPELRMDQCGIPKNMALELFKPYIYAGLIERELASNMRVARRMVEELSPEVWDVLEEIVFNRPVLLNRAPTLHRLGIQAFYPILVDGKAIKIHPLVCSAFNADFDGDQMAVHLPLSKKSQLESDRLILSTNNILSPSNGRPVTVPSQDMVLGLHFMTKIRKGSRGEGIVFSNVAEVITAFQCNSVELHAVIKVRLSTNEIVETTVGRVLVYESLPEGFAFHLINKILKRSDLGKLVEQVYYQFGKDATVLFLDRIKHLGFYYATISGISISIEDLIVPAEKDSIVHKAEKEVEKIESLYMDGIITNGERYNKVVGIWRDSTAAVAQTMYNELDIADKKVFANEDRHNKPFSPVFMMLESGARGTKDQVKQLVGMRGLMSKPTGEIIEIPVKSNFKQGLSVFEYFISTNGARKGQSDTALKTASSGYLTRRLVDVAQDVVVTIYDCNTLGYLEIVDLKDAGDTVYPIGKRVFGRVLAADVKDPVTGELLISCGEVVTRELMEKLDNSAVFKVFVRSVLSCQAKRGVCALCYGYDLSKSRIADEGTTVGIIAAQSIGEPGTQLTMRTFHIGGLASGLTEQPFVNAKYNGTVEWQGIRVVINPQGQMVVMSRKARILIVAPDGRELQNHVLEYGSIIYVKDKQDVAEGTKLADWDAYNKVLMTEKAGTVVYLDLIKNITIHERFDEATGKSRIIVMRTRGEQYQPAISIVDDKGEELTQYFLPEGSYVNVVEKQRVDIGDVLVKMPREVAKSKDITTGGLPRIAELFEARIPKDAAILSDVDGEVVIGGLHRGFRKVSVVTGADRHEYLVPRGKQLNVVDGEHVSAGDPLTAGAPVLHDILRILGIEKVQDYLVREIQKIYESQDVDINNRHFEVIVRQMLRKIRIVDGGESDFLIGDRVDYIHCQTVNAALRAQGKRPAVGKTMLMGLTQASLDTESFISAASFQETTRILTEAAMCGQVDHLFGLKENVIVGKLIPAGTGVKSFRKRYLGDDLSDLELQAQEGERRESSSYSSSLE